MVSTCSEPSVVFVERSPLSVRLGRSGFIGYSVPSAVCFVRFVRPSLASDVCNRSTGLGLLGRLLVNAGVLRWSRRPRTCFWCAFTKSALRTRRIIACDASPAVYFILFVVRVHVRVRVLCVVFAGLCVTVVGVFIIVRARRLVA
jgi:hypothetical protein